MEKTMIKRGLIFAAVILPVLAVMAWLLLGRFGPDRATSPGVQAPTQGFAFMELGAEAILSPALRQHLDERLGDGALEKIGTLDLTFDHRSLFQTVAPDIAELDRALNHNPRERVEHPIVRLTYRYPEYKDTPFDLVQLIFSRHDDRPLCFKIAFTREEADAAEALLAKYGPARSDTPLAGGGSLKRWEKPGQVMVLMQSADRLGRPTTDVMIYFIEAINALLTREKGGAGIVKDQDLF